eukprot:bmy_16193T0
MVLHYLQNFVKHFILDKVVLFTKMESFSPAIQLHLVHQAPCNVPPYLSKNESNLGDLLLGFLKYYATEFELKIKHYLVRDEKVNMDVSHMFL